LNLAAKRHWPNPSSRVTLSPERRAQEKNDPADQKQPRQAKGPRYSNMVTERGSEMGTCRDRPTTARRASYRSACHNHCGVAVRFFHCLLPSRGSSLWASRTSKTRSNRGATRYRKGGTVTEPRAADDFAAIRGGPHGRASPRARPDALQTSHQFTPYALANRRQGHLGMSNQSAGLTGANLP
jgi:hypothetical protein